MPAAFCGRNTRDAKIPKIPYDDELYKLINSEIRLQIKKSSFSLLIASMKIKIYMISLYQKPAKKINSTGFDIFCLATKKTQTSLFK